MIQNWIYCVVLRFKIYEIFTNIKNPKDFIFLSVFVSFEIGKY